jgi:hypothetical protein
MKNILYVGTGTAIGLRRGKAFQNGWKSCLFENFDLCPCFWSRIPYKDYGPSEPTNADPCGTGYRSTTLGKTKNITVHSHTDLRLERKNVCS